jgi:hypothetical protein
MLRPDNIRTRRWSAAGFDNRDIHKSQLIVVYDVASIPEKSLQVFPQLGIAFACLLSANNETFHPTPE